MERMRKIIAVDFDGVLCEDQWPQIGPEKKDNIELAKYRKQAGAALILWTCRCGEQLDEAVAWCRERGLEFDAVNENLPEPKRKTDRWIIAGAFDDFYQCPECGNMWPIFSTIEWTCCPVCQCRISSIPQSLKEADDGKL